MYGPSINPRPDPGFPERLIFTTLTYALWHWAQVAPHPLATEKFVDVQTGRTHPIAR